MAESMIKEEAQLGRGGRAVEAAWPDLFANLQEAYARVIDAQFELERRATELETSRDLLRQVIASMSEALFLLDRTGRIVQLNPAALKLIDCDEEKCLGRLFTTICVEPDAPTSAWKILNNAPQGVVTGLETSFAGNNGTTVPVSLSASVVRNRTGRIDGVLIVAQDVRPLQQWQAQLVQDSKQAALRVLANSIGRQLDDSLATIRGYTQHLLQTIQLERVTASQTKQDLKRIEQAAGKLAEMSGYLRELARLDYGTFKALNLNQVTEGALFLVGIQFPLDTLLIRRNYQPSIPAVQGNWHELAQLIVHMVESIEQIAGPLAALSIQTWAAEGKVFLQLDGRLISETNPQDAKPVLSDTALGIVSRHSGDIQRIEPATESIGWLLGLPGLEAVMNFSK